jgi:hypothetical protein
MVSCNRDRSWNILPVDMGVHLYPTLGAEGLNMHIFTTDMGRYQRYIYIIVYCSNFRHHYDAMNSSYFKRIKYIKKKAYFKYLQSSCWPHGITAALSWRNCVQFSPPQNCVMRTVFLMSNTVTASVKFHALRRGTRLTRGHRKWPKSYFM